MVSVTGASRSSGIESEGIIPFGSLDLTMHGTLSHFAMSTKSVQLLNFLLSLDRVDRWAIDFNENEISDPSKIQLFMSEFQDFVEKSLSVLHRVPAEFTEVLAHLTTTRCMYLIRYVGQHNPDYLAELAYLLAQDDLQSSDLLSVKKRIEAFGKAKLIGEIFSGHRLDLVMNIMGSYVDV